MSNEIKTQVVVLGAGPAGYSAAFRAADLGLDTIIVERFSTLGGVCLNVGCIPSKALLHVAKVIEEAKMVEDHGVSFGEPKIDLDKLRGFKEKVIGQLTGGLGGMSKMRKVDVVNGFGTFTGPNTLEVKAEDGSVKVVQFEHAIIAAGSRPIKLPFIPHEDPRIWDSTDALELKEVPGKLLVMGGGIIGLEMGTVYSSLGSEIDVVEMFDQVIPAAFVHEATRVDTTNDPASDYQYLWWIDEATNSYFANGDHGQFIYVDPGADIVIVRNGAGVGDVDWVAFLGDIAAYVTQHSPAE